ncbi:hypothetical protein YTPLAS18_31330 [Nitrospira sp.]|nr:hypothetical protein YTPLAS18_31330 [Nitrospira sp.]
MGELEWQISVALGVGLALTIGYRLYRKRAEAKRVDKLLADVVKGMDSFRR